jgi:hypothetical protein
MRWWDARLVRDGASGDGAQVHAASALSSAEKLLGEGD